MMVTKVTRAPGTDARRELPGGRSSGVRGVRPTPTGRLSVSSRSPAPAALVACSPLPSPPGRALRCVSRLPAALSSLLCDALFLLFLHRLSPRRSHMGPQRPPRSPGSWIPSFSLVSFIRQTCWPHLSAFPPNDLPFDLDSPDGTDSFLCPCCPHAATLSSLLPARRCPRLPHGWSPALRNH